MSNHWVVGANFNGDKKESLWVEQGVWILGWGPEYASIPAVRGFIKKSLQIQVGDRLAIKRWQGGADPSKIKILYIGTVRGIPEIYDVDGQFLCTVDWLNREPFQNRIVDSGGAIGAIYGPYEFNGNRNNDNWLREIFLAYEAG